MSICFIEHKNNLFDSSQQTTSSEVFTIPHQQGMYGIRDY